MLQTVVADDELRLRVGLHQLQSSLGAPLADKNRQTHTVLQQQSFVAYFLRQTLLCDLGAVGVMATMTACNDAHLPAHLCQSLREVHDDRGFARAAHHHIAHHDHGHG